MRVREGGKRGARMKMWRTEVGARGRVGVGWGENRIGDWDSPDAPPRARAMVRLVRPPSRSLSLWVTPATQPSGRSRCFGSGMIGRMARGYCSGAGAEVEIGREREDASARGDARGPRSARNRFFFGRDAPVPIESGLPAS